MDFEQSSASTLKRERRRRGAGSLPRRPTSGAARRPPHVLVLDEDRALARRVSRHLTRAGYQTILPHNLEDALRLLSHGGQEVDLLVVAPPSEPRAQDDWVRRALEPADGHPMVVLAGAEPRLHEEAGRIVLEKPFDSDQLLAAAEVALNGRPRPAVEGTW